MDSDEFLIELEATQRDNPLKSATTRVKIQIQDVNDNRPLFKTGHFEKSILENVPNGADIVKFTAIDKDSVRYITPSQVLFPYREFEREKRVLFS